MLLTICDEHDGCLRIYFAQLFSDLNTALILHVYVADQQVIALTTRNRSKQSSPFQILINTVITLNITDQLLYPTDIVFFIIQNSDTQNMFSSIINAARSTNAPGSL